MSCQCARTCGATCACNCHGFSSLNAGTRALARRTRLFDRARDLEARAGLRPYRVTILRGRATGMRKHGDGPTEITGEWLILPIPKVSGLDALSEVLDADQLREAGTVMLSGISLAYPESVLLGRGPDNTPIPSGETYWYEIAYLDPAARVTARRRFVNSSPPNANAERAEWTVSLTRVAWDR